MGWSLNISLNDMLHNFYKARLIFQVISCIDTHRQYTLKELVSAPNDVELFLRRAQVLCNLAQYEKQFLEKVCNFKSDCAQDYDIMHIFTDEIKAVADVNY